MSKKTFSDGKKEENKNKTSETKTEAVFADPEKTDNYYEHLKFKKRQNIALVMVGVVGLGIMGLAIWQMRSMLSVPIPFSPESTKVTVQEKETLDVTEQDPEELKKQDTDEDGLSDYDELNVYGTSVYLADTDSDGDDDFTEIKNHEDPTCPKGKTCFSSDKADELDQDQTLNNEMTDSNSVSGLSEEDYVFSADELRSFLLSSDDISPEQVQAISDQELLGFYETMLEENPEVAEKIAAYKQSQKMEQPGVKENESLDNSEVDIPDELENMSVDEVRQLLVEQGGFDWQTINQLDDESIMQIYYEALEKAKQDSQ